MERNEQQIPSSIRRLREPHDVYCKRRHRSMIPLRPSTVHIASGTSLNSSSRNCEVLGERSLLSQICCALRRRDEELSEAIEKIRIEGTCCLSVLESLEQEECEWNQKLRDIQKKITEAEMRKADAELLLQFHKSLGEGGRLQERVKTIQKTISADVPEDIQVMVDDCLNRRNGLHIVECIACFSEFKAEDLVSEKMTGKCRYAMYPCGHAATCGHCANKLWLTSRKCPLCRAAMTRKPEIFKPGRWQKECPTMGSE